MLRGGMVVPSFPEISLLARSLRGRPHPPVEGPGRPAAVLVCLCGGEVLLLRRAEHPLDPWSGHVSLPGGRYDDGDDGLLGTALRETEEEVGFAPLEEGRVLGALAEYAGRGRGIAAIRIAPFVVELAHRPALALSSEIASAHWIALPDLVPTRADVSELRLGVPAYRVQADGRELVIWGITHGILEELRAVR
jgi:8-oxo-dGTP pyrophosphatase MutT (NUDIX family)